MTLNSNIGELKTYEEYDKTRLVHDINEAYPNIDNKGTVIDEWDYIFNNNLFSESERREFLEFLRDLLKDKTYVGIAYITGVLTIAKYSAGSAFNMFKEHNILNDKKYDKYFGFTFD